MKTKSMGPIDRSVTTRAAIYLRVSTDEQTRSGLGLADQEERCRALATARGWHVVGVYRDEGVSGTIDPRRRPEAARLLEDARLRRVDVVLVLKIDRLARRAKWIHVTLEDLERVGVGFASVSEPVDTSSAMGKAFVGVAAVFAQLERDLIAERTSDALRQKRTRGEKTGGTIPYGFDVLEGGRLVENADEQAVLVLVRELRRAGQSLRAIAAVLEERGIRTKTGGAPWAPRVLSRVLAREAA